MLKRFHADENSSVIIQGNITAIRYRNDVARSVLLLHSRANLGMMMARDYASCHAASSKQRPKSQMACTKSGFKSYRPLVGPIHN